MRIHEILSESLLPTSAFVGSKKNKLGPAGQLKGSAKRAARQGDLVGEQGVAEGAPIVVAQAPIHIRNPKKAAQSYRNQGDIVPPTKPPSTEKRGVKGRPGQRPMPKHDEDIAEDQSVSEKTDADLCRSSKRLGSSDHSSCVSQGLRAHQSKGKGHTDGQGSYIKGKKIRGSKYGGPLPDQDGK
jgi:hypothetical protein